MNSRPYIIDLGVPASPTASTIADDEFFTLPDVTVLNADPPRDPRIRTRPWNELVIPSRYDFRRVMPTPSSSATAGSIGAVAAQSFSNASASTSSQQQPQPQSQPQSIRIPTPIPVPGYMPISSVSNPTMVSAVNSSVYAASSLPSSAVLSAGYEPQQSRGQFGAEISSNLSSLARRRLMDYVVDINGPQLAHELRDQQVFDRNTRRVVLVNNNANGAGTGGLGAAETPSAVTTSGRYLGDGSSNGTAAISTSNGGGGSRNTVMPETRGMPRTDEEEFRTPPEISSGNQIPANNSASSIWSSLLAEPPDTPEQFAPEISPTLANLIKKAAAEVVSPERYKRRRDALKRPENLTSLQVSRVPHAIWDTMSRTSRQKDLIMREITSDLLAGISGIASSVATRNQTMNARQFGIAMQVLAGIKVKLDNFRMASASSAFSSTWKTLRLTNGQVENAQAATPSNGAGAGSALAADAHPANSGGPMEVFREMDYLLERLSDMSRSPQVVAPHHPDGGWGAVSARASRVAGRRRNARQREDTEEEEDVDGTVSTAAIPSPGPLMVFPRRRGLYSPYHRRRMGDGGGRRTLRETRVATPGPDASDVAED